MLCIAFEVRYSVLVLMIMNVIDLLTFDQYQTLLTEN